MRADFTINRVFDKIRELRRARRNGSGEGDVRNIHAFGYLVGTVLVGATGARYCLDIS